MTRGGLDCEALVCVVCTTLGTDEPPGSAHEERHAEGALQAGKTKAEIIRELLLKEMN